MDLLSGLRKVALPAGEQDQSPSVVSGLPLEKMPETALVFLEDPLARRLAVAWSVSGGDEDAWLECAGVTAAQTPDAFRLCRALRLNGVCRDGGVTDTLALRYIAALVSEPLRKTTRTKPQRRR